MRNLPPPKAWYYAGKGATFNGTPRRVSLPGKDVVVFRTRAGQLRAIQANCAHMNFPLEKGVVTGSHLRCSLHQWVFDASGACVAIPGAKPQAIPRFACLETFSIEERHGHVFVHTAGPGRSLPFFPGMSPLELECARVRALAGETHWSLATSNAFDLAHFEFVHHRRPTTLPRVDESVPEAISLTLGYEILGNAPADRWLTKRYGKAASLDYQVWNGNLIFAQTRIGHFVNRMMFIVHPTSSGFDAFLFVYTPKSTSPLRHLTRELAAHFSWKFFAQECRELKGIRFDLNRAGPHDALLARYANWLYEQAADQGLRSLHLDDASDVATNSLS